MLPIEVLVAAFRLGTAFAWLKPLSQMFVQVLTAGSAAGPVPDHRALASLGTWHFGTFERWPGFEPVAAVVGSVVVEECEAPAALG